MGIGIKRKNGHPVSPTEKPMWVFIGFMYSPIRWFSWWQWFFYLEDWHEAIPFVRRHVIVFGFVFLYQYVRLGCEMNELNRARAKRSREYDQFQ